MFHPLRRSGTQAAKMKNRGIRTPLLFLFYFTEIPFLLQLFLALKSKFFLIFSGFFEIFTIRSFSDAKFSASVLCILANSFVILPTHKKDRFSGLFRKNGLQYLNYSVASVSTGACIRPSGFRR